MGDACNFRRVQGDSLPGLLFLQPGFHGKARAQGQVFQGDNRGVGDNGNLQSLLHQGPGGVPALVFQLKLALAAKGWSHQAGALLCRQLFGNEMALGAVIQSDTHPEFLCYAQGGEDIICPVGVAFQRNFPPHYRQHGMELHVKVRLLVFFGILLPGIQGFLIVLRLLQGFPQQGGGAHTGDGRFFVIPAVAALGVFPKGYFHGHRVLHHHVVHPPAAKLYSQESAPHHIGAAGAGDGGGHPVAVGIEKSLVHGIQAVDTPHVGGDRVGAFVVIRPFKADGLFVQADMAVALHKARGH